MEISCRGGGGTRLCREREKRAERNPFLGVRKEAKKTLEPSILPTSEKEKGVISSSLRKRVEKKKKSSIHQEGKDNRPLDVKKRKKGHSCRDIGKEKKRLVSVHHEEKRRDANDLLIFCVRGREKNRPQTADLCLEGKEGEKKKGGRNDTKKKTG